MVYVRKYRLLFLPILQTAGITIKARVRYVGWRGFYKALDVFDNGKRVYRYWIGFVLLTAMVENAPRQ
jgi:hypothetical protein